MPNKSDIFRKPSIKEITKGRRLVTSQGDVIRDLLSIDPEKEYLVIDGNIIPEKFFYKKDATGKIYTRTTANRKFMKHGPEIHFPTFNSIEEAVEADATFSMLMGDDVQSRKEFIQENATEARLDV